MATRRCTRLHGTIAIAISTDATTLDRAGLAEREGVLALLRAKEVELRALGVRRLGLFGSIARGEAGPESDVDLLAEIDHSSRFSLLDLVGLQFDLEDLIGRKVEIATAAKQMRPRMRRRVEAMRPTAYVTEPSALQCEVRRSSLEDESVFHAAPKPMRGASSPLL